MPAPRDPYAQEGFRCRLAWGVRGVRQAAARGDAVVVVDVLSFATAAATAVSQGAWIYPSPPGSAARALAERVGAELAVGRGDGPGRSLSPASLDGLGPKARIVLASPNGSACCAAGRAAPDLLVAGLVNAGAAAAAVERLLAAGLSDVTVVAAGERWRDPAPDEDGLRVAVEDLLGAGALLARLEEAGRSCSPEARAAAAAFRGLRGDLAALLAESASGRELRAAGFADDVDRAAALDALAVVPVLRGDHLEALE